VYDPVALTAAQMEWLPLGTTLRPFAYPPTALLFIKPLALLPYGVALGTWSTAGMMAISGAALLYGRRGLLGLASTPVGVGLVAGQISLITGGCLAVAVAMLRRNEVVSGVLFGCLFVIKPQVALLVPVGLLAGRHFKAIGIAALPVAGGAIASLSLGPHLWLDWLGALPQFAKETATPAYGRMNIALGWHFAPFGIALVGFVFWRSTSPVYRLIALVCGTVLCVPYLMIYDLAAMSPAIAVLLLRPLEYFQAPDVQQTRLRTTMP
jgi:hypothetical protein